MMGLYCWNSLKLQTFGLCCTRKVYAGPCVYAYAPNDYYVLMACFTVSTTPQCIACCMCMHSVPVNMWS